MAAALRQDAEECRTVNLLYRVRDGTRTVPKRGIILARSRCPPVAPHPTANTGKNEAKITTEGPSTCKYLAGLTCKS